MKTTKLSQLGIVPEEYDIDHCRNVDYTDIHSEMSDCERQFVSGLIRYYEPSNIIELGVSRGGGTVNILNAISDLDSKCVSIDVAETFWGNGNELIACDVDRRRVDPEKWKLITGHDPVDVIEELDTKFDFAIIDTAHKHPIESLNFLTILPFLNDGAIVCLHDVIVFYLTVGQGFANRILAMCVCADKLEPRNAEEYNMTLPNMVAFQVTQETRKHIRGVFDSLAFPWEMFPDRLESFTSYFSRHYSNDLCSLFQNTVKFQRKYYFISLIGGIILSYELGVRLLSWKDLGENIVFYGAGNEMLNLLQASEDYGLSFDSRIWDINAEKIISIKGHKVDAPDFTTRATNNAKLCVTIKDVVVYKQVERQMSDLGYKVFHGIRALVDDVRYELSAANDK